MQAIKNVAITIAYGGAVAAMTVWAINILEGISHLG